MIEEVIEAIIVSQNEIDCVVGFTAALRKAKEQGFDDIGDLIAALEEV